MIFSRILNRYQKYRVGHRYYRNLALIASMTACLSSVWLAPVTYAQYQSYSPQTSYPPQQQQYGSSPQAQYQYQPNNQPYQPYQQAQQSYGSGQPQYSAAPQSRRQGNQYQNANGQTYMVGGRPATQQSFQAAQLMTQANDLLNQNRMSEALPLFERAISLAPEQAVSHRQLCSLFSQVRTL